MDNPASLVFSAPICDAEGGCWFLLFNSATPSIGMRVFISTKCFKTNHPK